MKSNEKVVRAVSIYNDNLTQLKAAMRAAKVDTEVLDIPPVYSFLLDLASRGVVIAAAVNQAEKKTRKPRRAKEEEKPAKAARKSRSGLAAAASAAAAASEDDE